MPEGHTLHRLAQDHQRWFAGQTVRVSSPQGRFDDGAALLDGLALFGVTAIGKHLLYQFADVWLHVHLGLFGKFRMTVKPAAPRPTVRLRIEVPGRQLELTGPTDCAVWDDTQVRALRDRLGPDPLDPEASLARFTASLRRRRKAIGAALLDQSVVSGIGNVYRAELLFLGRIDPHRPASSLTDAESASLWADMRRLLDLGVQTNRIITTDPAAYGKPASKLLRGERTWVYKHATCKVCSGPIARDELGARTLYWCPRCQCCQD